MTSPTEMRGQGLTLKGADTVFIENLAIRYANQQLYYVVDFKGLPKPVYFKFTSLTSNGFVCENPDNDFPKKIVYNRSGNRIEAYISAHDKRVDYLFVRELVSSSNH